MVFRKPFLPFTPTSSPLSPLPQLVNKASAADNTKNFFILIGLYKFILF